MARHCRQTWPTTVTITISTEQEAVILRRLLALDNPGEAQLGDFGIMPVLGMRPNGAVRFAAELPQQRCSTAEELQAIRDVFERDLGFARA